VRIADRIKKLKGKQNMALTDENNGNGFYMPVAPAYMGGNQGGFGGFGGDSWGW
jgi:hypothetical protein